MPLQKGETLPCARCNQHRDANIHVQQHGYYSYHKYVDPTDTTCVRIAVDRKAAAKGEPPIHVLETDRRYSRVQILDDQGNVIAEVRWSGTTTDKPTVWVEAPLRRLRGVRET